MAIKFISVKCPECGAALDVEEGRKQIFCSYCGTKVMIQNDNEYIFRHVDEAGIKQAETERLIRLKELELEEAEDNRGRKGRTIAFGVALAFVIIGAISMAFGGDLGMGAIGIGGWIALFTVINGDESKKRKQETRMARAGRIKLTSSVSDYDKKNYQAVESAYRSLGFKNIHSVNMRDLRMGLLKKPGIVEEVSIDGESPRSGEWYDPNATVVITYHGLDN